MSERETDNMVNANGCRDLHAALEAAHSRYTQQHPISKADHERACKVMPGGNTRTVLHTTPFPLSIASGQSHSLTTKDGHVYLDFLNEYTAGIYGHDHPVIRQAIDNALQSGWNYGAHHDREEQLAALITARFPAMDLVRFVNSGTEANMMALATALAYTGRKTILIFEHGYHGSTISGRQSTGKPTINLPHDFVVAKYNDVAGTKALVEKLPSDTLAAILVEPMLGSGGCYVGSYEFLTSLREIAALHNALLIFDEVMTSRLAFHGLGAYMGFKPDLMTLGKYLGGGMSFGAFGGRADIMSMYDPRSNQLEHPGTFNNNVFSMTAGIAGAKLLDTETLSRLNGLGDMMRNQLSALFFKHKIEGKLPAAPGIDAVHTFDHPNRPPKMFVLGIGSLMTIHFGGPDRDILQSLYFHHMLEQGYYLAQRGFIALSIELRPEHVNRFVNSTALFCEHYEADLQW